MNLNEALGLECWNVQADGSALSPLSGVGVSITHGGERALLELRSGWRTIFDARRGGLLIAPAVRVAGGVTLRAVSARAWRDESLVLAAAALREFGAGSGVFGRPDWASGDWSLSAEDDAGRWVNVRRYARGFDDADGHSGVRNTSGDGRGYEAGLTFPAEMAVGTCRWRSTPLPTHPIHHPEPVGPAGGENREACHQLESSP